MNAETVAGRVTQAARTVLPTKWDRFQAIGFFDLLTGDEHLVLVSPLGLGSPRNPALVRMQSECLTGDVFGSQRCDCGAQLQQAMALIAHQPGALIYLRGHEGRGVGLLAKLQAYRLQDEGLDTVEAQLELGLPVDCREYGAAAAILDALGATRIRLLTNNPDKIKALSAAGIDLVSVEPLLTPPTLLNAAYLRAKRDRFGHHLAPEGRPNDAPLSGATPIPYQVLPGQPNREALSDVPPEAPAPGPDRAAKTVIPAGPDRHRHPS